MSALVLTGSARAGSFTRRLGEHLAELPGVELAPVLTELPFFDQDLEPNPPARVSALREAVAAADTILIATVEYNGTISGLLGNAIDWLSRPLPDGSPSVLRGKPVITVAASPGPLGGVRALVALRTVLGNAGAELVGDGVAVPEVHRALDGLEDAENLVGEIWQLRELLSPALV